MLFYIQFENLVSLIIIIYWLTVLPKIIYFIKGEENLFD